VIREGDKKQAEMGDAHNMSNAEIDEHNASVITNFNNET
jgi:hypothetical protein